MAAAAPAGKSADFCTSKPTAYTSSEGGDYTLGRRLVAPQVTVAFLVSAKGYFLRRSAVHLLEDLTCWLRTACSTFQRGLWEGLRGFAAVNSRERTWVSSWCWHGGEGGRSRVTLHPEALAWMWFRVKGALSVPCIHWCCERYLLSFSPYFYI